MTTKDQVMMRDNSGPRAAGEPCVWVSNAEVKSELLFGFTCQMQEDDFDLMVARVRAFQRGEILAAEDLPPEMWISSEYANHDRRNLPHLFKAGGYFTVSEAFAEVLRGFDLGRTRLHPVDLLHVDRKERFPGQHYFLNIAEVHRHFSPELSARFEPVPDPQTSYIACLPGGGLQDDDLTVSPAALAGPAIWLDNSIVGTLFLSDPLVAALRAAKLTRRLPLFRCRVAAVN